MFFFHRFVRTQQLQIWPWSQQELRKDEGQSSQWVPQFSYWVISIVFGPFIDSQVVRSPNSILRRVPFGNPQGSVTATKVSPSSKGKVLRLKMSSYGTCWPRVWSILKSFHSLPYHFMAVRGRTFWSSEKKETVSLHFGYSWWDTGSATIHTKGLWERS